MVRNGCRFTLLTNATADEEKDFCIWLRHIIGHKMSRTKIVHAKKALESQSLDSKGDATYDDNTVLTRPRQRS